MDVLKKGIVIIFFIFSYISLLKVLFLPSYSDFTIYHAATNAWLSGMNPYLKFGNLAYFLYPPISLFLLLPFSFIPLQLAGKLWIVANILLLFVNLKVLFSLYRIKFISVEALCIFSIIFIAFPTKFTFGMGQINIVIFSFLALMYFFFKKKKDFESGVFLGLAILLKLQPLLFIIYFLLKKKWSILGGFVLAIILGSILSFIFLPEHIIRYYFLQVIPDLLFSFPKEYYNQSLTGFLGHQFRDNSNISLIRIILSGLIVCTTFIFILRDKKKQNEIFHLNILLVTQLLLNNISWQHYFILLVLPLLHLYTIFKRSHRSWYYVGILAVILFLTGINIGSPEKFPVFFTSHVFYGTMILWIYMLYILKKYD